MQRRLAGEFIRSGRSPISMLKVQGLNFAVKGFAPDAQDLGGFGLVPVHMVEHFFNMRALNLWTERATTVLPVPLSPVSSTGAWVGHVHAMAHQLGGYYDLPHGVCNAILLPHVDRFNMIAKMDRFVDVAVAMGENVEGLSVRAATEKTLEAIETLSADIGIPAGLEELDVGDEDLKIMAENAQKDACGLTNPRCPNLEDVIQIYKNAL